MFNWFLKIAVCLLLTVNGAIALRCYASLEVTCTGADECAQFEQQFPDRPLTKTDCGPLVDLCVKESYEFSGSGVTLSLSDSGCVVGNPGGYGVGCFGEDDIRNMDLKAVEELEALGLDLQDAVACLCDTDYCNGVTRSVVSISMIAASVLVSSSFILG